MARQHAQTPVVPEPPKPTFRELIGQAWFPRLSEYGSRCTRLAALAAELPPDPVRLPDEFMTARFGDRTYPRAEVLVQWVSAVLEENVLAGVVLTDALDFTFGLLRTGRVREFPESAHKSKLTTAAGEYWIEFTVPPGWEFVLGPDVHPAGFTGLAMVQRCHLSQNFYQGNAGRGRLLGAPGAKDDVGFDIPCGYFSGYRIEGDRLVIPSAPLGRLQSGVGVQVPYAFVRRAFSTTYTNEPLVFVPRPTHEEVENLARSAAARLRSEWESSSPTPSTR